MMNDTVARIVDLMFENVEMNEEVAALRDEVMNNCQERYADLVGSGMAEDDAVAAVVESLKGMEDVVSQYQRRTRRAAQPQAECVAPDEDEEIDPARDVTFAASAIHRINVALVSEDVRIEASDDYVYHVCWDAEEDPQIVVREENGVLHVERSAGDIGKAGAAAHKVCVDARDGLQNARITIDGEEKNLDEIGRVVGRTMEGVGSMMENLGRSLGRMFSGLRNAFTGGDGVVIRVPEDAIPHVKVLTTSGDVEVTDVALTDLNVTSTSGDVTVHLGAAERIEKAEFRTVSGDVDVDLHADSLLANTTSGDVDVRGVVREVFANTVSGDVDVCAETEHVTFKTVSGDVDLEFETIDVREINGGTVSGDVDVDLPDGIGCIVMTTQTRSGDVTSRYATDGKGPTLTGKITSMSGDITIR